MNCDAPRKVKKIARIGGSTMQPLVPHPLLFLYFDCWETDYSAKWPYGISGTDPGAVPGASTSFSGGYHEIAALNGGESGSTYVIKVWLALGMAPPLSGHGYTCQ